MQTKLFTPQEIEILRENPYTLSVTEETIRYTLPFKQEYWRRHTLGQSATHIFIELGYDVSILGKGRVYAFASHVKKEAASKTGLHEGTYRRGLRTDIPNYTGMSNNEALARMQRELLYMRQELEFVKKIIKADNSGGRKQ
jgi:hypothetical protein